MSDQQYDFPTEVITLPSEGRFYPEEHPLSSGEVEIKYMTAKEEDILTSQNLIKKGVVIDKLLESVIVTDFDIDDLLIGDKNAVTFTTRILGYGNKYNVKYTCSSCGEESKQEVNLKKLETKDVDLSQFPKGKNEFDFELPKSEVNIKWKLLTHGDEKAIRNEIQALQKTRRSETNPTLTTRLKHIIIEVDGSREVSDIRSFVDNRLLSIDSLELRRHIEDVSPDIDLSHEFVCSHCGNQEVLGVPLGIGFFWPGAER